MPEKMAERDRAVVDRIVDGTHAVLLIGDEEIEHVVSADRLPEGTAEGTWLYITRDDAGEFIELEIAEEATAEAQERIASKLDQLRQGDSRLRANA